MPNMYALFALVKLQTICILEYSDSRNHTNPVKEKHTF